MTELQQAQGLSPAGTDPNPAPAREAQPAQQTSGQAASPSAEGDPDRFRGKGREELIGLYRDLEKKHGQTSEQFQTLAEFFRRVQPFFKFNPDDSVELNDEMVKAYAQNRGWLSANGGNEEGTKNMQQTQNLPSPATPNGAEDGEAFMEQLAQQGPKAIRDIIREEIAGAMKENLVPHITEFYKDRGERYIDVLSQKYPDFKKYLNDAREFATNNNFQIRTIEDMERAYKAVKAFKGDYVDKAQHEALLDQLRQAQQIIRPGAGNNQAAMDPNATVDDLLGLKSMRNDPAADFNLMMFGKPQLKPHQGR